MAIKCLPMQKKAEFFREHSKPWCLAMNEAEKCFWLRRNCSGQNGQNGKNGKKGPKNGAGFFVAVYYGNLTYNK